PISCGSAPCTTTTLVLDKRSNIKYKAWIYDLNVRQEISDHLMVYASYGRNWRAPGASQGNVPSQYFIIKPEVSKNYEVGIKGDVLDRRVNFTFAAFQQDYTNYNASVSNVLFLDATGTVQPAFSITFNGDARVRGLEGD